jgi:hypothetical protein
LLRVELLGQARGAHQIAKHNGEVAPLDSAIRRLLRASGTYNAGRCRWPCSRVQLGDCLN